MRISDWSSDVCSADLYAGTIFNGTSVVYLGKFRSTGFDDSPLDGFLDQARFIVGTAVYTTTFTPPSDQYVTRDSVLESATAQDFDDRIYRCTTAGPKIGRANV